ncbi:MAG: GNAT family N-acetyltransferase [Lachnospiraceae bacterium]|nr:GNAT family N-acetyltransferase [Lachnospiraceae bacterium]
MIFEPITVKDKLGRDVVIRNAQLQDCEILIDYMKVTSAQTPFLLREPDEITLTMEEEKSFVQGKIDAERELMLCAFVDGKLAGNAALMNHLSFKRYQHRCDVAVALYQEYWSCGIGRTLLEKVLEAAKKAGYEQAELNVVEGNEKAISLYKKLGFTECGKIPRSMKYPDGSYRDEFVMVKEL